MSKCKHCKDNDGIKDFHEKLTEMIVSSDVEDHEIGFALIVRGVAHLLDAAPTYEVGFRTCLAGFDAGIKVHESSEEEND